MEIENLEVIPFDQIGKEPEPKKEKTAAEEELRGIVEEHSEVKAITCRRSSIITNGVC